MTNAVYAKYPPAPELRFVSVGDTVLVDVHPSRLELRGVERETATGLRIGGAWFYRSTGRAYKADNWDVIYAVVPVALVCPKCGEPTLQKGDFAKTTVCWPCQYRLRPWETTGGAT